KAGGVYLISGGAGGLGQIVAQEIAGSVEGARLMLLGRSALNAASQRKLEALRGTGAVVEYETVDVSDAEQVKRCVEGVLARHGRLDGVVHGAGVIRDSFLIHKTADELRAVLAAKVAGTINLDEATQGLPLDFFLTFSSVAAVLGNVGQGDYALANAFMDRYAEYRAQLQAAGQRSGRSVSINWPLWSEGGMQVGKAD